MITTENLTLENIKVLKEFAENFETFQTLMEELTHLSIENNKQLKAQQTILVAVGMDKAAKDMNMTNEQLEKILDTEFKNGRNPKDVADELRERYKR